MATIRAQVILHTADAVPENYISNSFCFDGMDTGGDDAAIVTMLKDFYDDLTPATMSSVVTQNGHEVKLSQLPGLAPNYPYFEGTFNLASAWSGSPMPSEVALALSFQGVRSAGAPQARRRGRVYIGPFGSNANTSGRPAAAVLTFMANAATTMQATAASIATSGGWAVWSVADQTAVPVDNGWIDNSWDTQRRRGLVYTSRTLW